MKSLIRFSMLVALAFTTVASASNWEPITQCGFVINSPGRYRVQNNLFCAQNDAFAIAIQNTEHVELDLQNYQLRMPGGQQRGIGIYVQNSKHVDIKADKDAFIYNFQTGISLWGYVSGGNLLENRNVDIHGGGMRLFNNRVGLLVRYSRDIEAKSLRTQNNTTDWSLFVAKDIDFDRINLPANQY